MDEKDELKGSLADYWRDVLVEPKYVVAPMVEQSELAWRLLSRRHGAQLCFTPMLHSTVFSCDATYRKENLVTCREDRPLIAQFCANEPEVLLQSCQLAATQCDGVDLNLGCPQLIAKRGYYGAFLQDDWDRVRRLVSTVSTRFHLPLSCKIRVFRDVEKTVEYAKMIEAAGCQLLTVHGRHREQKGALTGLASWEHIAAVKRAVRIPVIANGNIQLFSDIDKCLLATGADAVMSAEGNLHNPGLFENTHYPSWELADEYLDLVEQHPCALSSVRGHLFKLFHHSLLQFPDLRDELAAAGSLSDFRAVVAALRHRCQESHNKYLDGSEWPVRHGLRFPHWICQPCFRSSVWEPREMKEARESRRKRHHDQLDEMARQTGLSKRRLRKMAKNPGKRNSGQPRRHYVKCACGNPQGGQCQLGSCRKCCKTRCLRSFLNCTGHRFWFKNLAERSQIRTEDQSP